MDVRSPPAFQTFRVTGTKVRESPMLLKNSTFAELCESFGSLIVIARSIVPSCEAKDFRRYGELHQPPKVLGDSCQ